MQRKKLLIGVLAIALCVGIASAALIPYYGQITGTVNVAQAVTLDDLSYSSTDFTETVTGAGTDILTGDGHYLKNNADNKITVEFVSSGEVEGLDAYPEYKLDATIDDDVLFVALDSAIAWTDFTGISLDYLIDSDVYGTNWIPQITIALRDGDGNPVYLVAWHSFRTGITGTVDERTSITYLKDDFYIYALDWSLLGFWKDAGAGLIAEMNPLTFSYFVQQAGDTSVDPNTGADPGGQPYWPAKSAQIVWVSNHEVPTKTVTGVKVLPTGGYGPVLEKLEFRMVYELHAYLTADTYTVVTTVEFVE